MIHNLIIINRVNKIVKINFLLIKNINFANLKSMNFYTKLGIIDLLPREYETKQYKLNAFI